MSAVQSDRVAVLGVPITVIDWPTTLQRIADWAAAGSSRYVCICNVHSVVTASRDRDFQEVIARADMATPDGAPVAWMLRRLGRTGQPRINGPDLMWRYCERAANDGTPIYLLGSTDDTLATVSARLRAAFPSLAIAGTYSPPFRALTTAEDEALTERIRASGARVVFVSLGCPKQERWMADHRSRLPAVQIGVGAAFDFHSGRVARAPAWMRDVGLEWLHRLLSEPRRLWKRYLTTNSLFVIGAAKQLLGRRRA